MTKKTHTLTVCRARGYEYRDRVPCLTIQGKWLKKMGIEVGDKVSVYQDNERIIVELVNKVISEKMVNKSL